MKFLAEETRDDGDYSVTFDAPDWEAARTVCKENAWRLSGEVGAIIPASPSFGMDQADAMIDAMNEDEQKLRH